jgi:5-methylcytosine-specific restriction endonuclease McrA
MLDSGGESVPEPVSQWRPPGERERDRRRRAAFFQKGRCFLCSKSLDYEAKGEAATSWHHFIPRGRGGPDASMNRVVAHASCNNRFGDRMPTLRQWLRFMVVHMRRGNVAGW